MIYLFTFTLLLISFLSLYAIIVSGKNYKMLFLMVPVFSILTATSFYTFNYVLGRPIEGNYMSQEFRYLSHWVVEKQIFVWVKMDDKKYPETYVFPYSQKLHQQLQEAENAKKRGKGVKGTNKNSDKITDENRIGIEGDLQFYDFSQTFLLRKED